MPATLRPPSDSPSTLGIGVKLSRGISPTTAWQNERSATVGRWPAPRGVAAGPQPAVRAKPNAPLTSGNGGDARKRATSKRQTARIGAALGFTDLVTPGPATLVRATEVVAYANRTRSGVIVRFGAGNAGGDTFSPSTFARTLAHHPDRWPVFTRGGSMPVGAVSFTTDDDALRMHVKIAETPAGDEALELLRAGALCEVAHLRSLDSHYTPSGQLVHDEIAIDKMATLEPVRHVLGAQATPTAPATAVRSESAAPTLPRTREERAAFVADMDRLVARVEKLD